MDEIWDDTIVDFTTGRNVREYIERRDAAALTLETQPSASMLSFDVPTYGDVQILSDGTASKPKPRKPLTQETAAATSDLAQAIGLCAVCGPKLDVFLANRKKLQKYDAESPYDIETGERPTMTSEDARATHGGLLAPDIDHWFSQEQQDAQLAGGLIRPDAMPDAQVEQLRQLMLARPVRKRSAKLSLEQLQRLGWAPDDEPVSLPAHLETCGGLYEPDF